MVKYPVVHSNARKQISSCNFWTLVQYAFACFFWGGQNSAVIALWLLLIESLPNSLAWCSNGDLPIIATRQGYDYLTNASLTALLTGRLRWRRHLLKLCTLSLLANRSFRAACWTISGNPRWLYWTTEIVLLHHNTPALRSTNSFSAFDRRHRYLGHLSTTVVSES